MSTVQIHGIAQSSYLWSARIGCMEKGVDAELVPAPPRSDAMRALHPWGKVPALTHGDVTLYETSAILRYVDAAFDGPSLIPADPLAAAKVEQWISILNCYAYRVWVPNYILKYLFAGETGPDRTAIDGNLPELARILGLFNDALAGEGPFLTGEQYTIADILLAPVVAGVAMFPEGKAAVGGLPDVGRFLGAATSRPSFGATAPPRG